MLRKTFFALLIASIITIFLLNNATAQAADEMLFVDPSDSLDAPLESAMAIPSVSLTSIKIQGPAYLLEGKTAQYKVRATFSNGTTSVVTSGVTWSDSYAKATINSTGLLTVGQAVGGNVKFSITAKYTFKGVTKTSSRSVTILDGQTLNIKSVAVTGEPYPLESGSYQYSATVTLNDDTTFATQNCVWSENSSNTTISTTGKLTTAGVTGNQTANISANCTYNGIAMTGTKAVKILDRQLKNLDSLTIQGPTVVTENKTGTFSLNARYTNSTTSTNVTTAATWTENSDLTTISKGILTVAGVPKGQLVTITAQYSENGITRTTQAQVWVIPVGEEVDSFYIEGPDRTPDMTNTYYYAKLRLKNGTVMWVSDFSNWRLDFPDSQFGYFPAPAQLYPYDLFTGTQPITMKIWYRYLGVIYKTEKTITIYDQNGM